MKYAIRLSAILTAALVLSTITRCKKTGTSPSKQNSASIEMHPVTSTFIQTGGEPITYQYSYDNDNNLEGYGSAGEFDVTADAHTVTQSSFTPEFDDVVTYSYSGPSNAPVDIYTDIPSQMSINMYNKNVLAGTSTTSPGYLWGFEGSKSLITKMYTSDGGGENIDFTYDANKNLNTISFTNLSGTQAGKVVVLMTVTGVDNHPSPYSAVKGYNLISYPQYNVSDYGLAYCKNNPTQIIYKQFDYNKGDLETSEQDDFTYLYNSQGYPMSITVNVTSFGTTKLNSTRNHTYTYQ